MRPRRRCNSALFRPHSFGTSRPVAKLRRAAVCAGRRPPPAERVRQLDFRRLQPWLVLHARGSGGCFCAASAPRAPSQQFHNVSINKAAYDYFLANGRFPERTVLVMQVFEAADKEPRGGLASGVFNGRRIGLEVAVKNTSRPDGKATPWAYYNFTDPSDRSKVLASATAFPDENCANCHQRHASIDNVWVQFYPALRDRRPKL
jgi:hypothetical protein